MGYLSGDDAKANMAEGKHAAEVSDEDFPADVVEYLKEGIDFAMKSPVPPAEEGAMWVFKEN